MKKFIKLTVLILVIVLISGCNKDSKYLKEITYKEYKNMIENNETFILEIMKTNCSACQSFKPKLEEVLEEYQIEIKYINTKNLNEEDYNELFDTTGATGTPTVIFYKDGQEETVASRINGSVSKEKIISKFKSNGFIK